MNTQDYVSIIWHSIELFVGFYIEVRLRSVNMRELYAWKAERDSETQMLHDNKCQSIKN